MNQRVSLVSMADALSPPRGALGSLERFRHRALVITLFLSALSALLASPVYAFSGLGVTAGMNVLFAASLGLVLLWVRLGASTVAGFYALLTLTPLFFLADGVVEQPFDFSSMSWSLIMPITGLLVDGWRGGRIAAVLGLLLGPVNLGLHELGWTLVVQAPVTGGIFLLRYVTLFLGVVLLIATYEVLRTSAMSEAERATKARSMFLANMSHELRTPMNGVIGMTETLLQTPLTGRQREDLQVISRSGRALIELINDLLDLSRIESGRLQLDVGPTDLSAIARDVVDLNLPVATKKGVALTLTVADDFPPLVQADALRVRQVLTNLVNNAVKYTEVGGIKVLLGVKHEAGGRKLLLAVRDTGVGIAPPALARLFQPFQQVDASPSRRFGGSGLGLALVHELTRAMAGDVEVDSTPQVGSEFRVSLPCREATAPAALEVKPVSGAPARSGGRVLVVDDNPINLRVAAGLLEHLGYTVETAVNGLEAIERLRRDRFTVVLMDCHMPEVDGYEATRRVRAFTGERANVPILAVTASVLADDVQACLACGMNDVLAKPITLEQLALALEKLEHPRVPVGR